MCWTDFYGPSAKTKGSLKSLIPSTIYLHSCLSRWGDKRKTDGKSRARVGLKYCPVQSLAGAGAIYKQVFSLPFFFFDSGFWILTNVVTSQFLEISGSRNYGIGKVLCIIFRINFTWKACGGGSCFSFECRLCFILKAWVTRSGCVVSAGFEAVGLGRVIQST